jgi:hypothetical protein
MRGSLSPEGAPVPGGTKERLNRRPEEKAGREGRKRRPEEKAGREGRKRGRDEAEIGRRYDASG